LKKSKDNRILVRAHDDKIMIICNTESQQKTVINQMVNDKCIFEGYEEWDEGKDMKWILTFRLIDEMEKKPYLN
jgi:hypothetical protein|tara:strand:- start:337 stop:558 length:222 start_codon:yes stop_codon:yes gene_type:complete